MKTRRFCPHCGRELRKSRTKGYAFECRYCGEDFYKIEVLKKDLPQVKALRKRKTVPAYDRWWYSTDFKTMELVSRYRHSDFDPDEGYQAFADVCDEWWEALSLSEKQDFYKQYN
jgi:DNA-directed RNA polymerase subunit RPC12/RpoP